MKNKLQYIKHKNLDVRKYDICIEAAANSQIYAFSWYLNSVADDWDVIVLGDYEVVMPIPFLKLKRHLFVKKIYQPDFCQQLGVFSKKKITSAIFQLFFDRLLALKPKSYNFNSYDTKNFLNKSVGVSDRVNYELNISDSYENLLANYSTNLKRNINRAKKATFSISGDVSVKDFVSLKKGNTTYKTGAKQYLNKEKLLNEISKRGFGKVYGVFHDEKLVAGSFIIHYKNRFISLTSATDEIGKKQGAISYLFDQIIREHSETKNIFDFEGSMIPGVARFFKSFGAEKVMYKSLFN